MEADVKIAVAGRQLVTARDQEQLRPHHTRVITAAKRDQEAARSFLD
jgi:hypothetical protein